MRMSRIATGLLEAGVFLEAGIEVPDGRMKRVGLGDAVGKLLRGGIGDVHLASIAHGPAVRFAISSMSSRAGLLSKMRVRRM